MTLSQVCFRGHSQSITSSHYSHLRIPSFTNCNSHARTFSIAQRGSFGSFHNATENFQCHGKLCGRKISRENGGDGSEADCSSIMPVHFLFLSRSTHAKSGWAKPVLPYIQTKQQITACPSNPTMHQGMCHCHHAAAVQSPCSHRHQSCCCTLRHSTTPPGKKKKKGKKRRRKKNSPSHASIFRLAVLDFSLLFG